MGLLDRKVPKQAELEKKIKALRDIGMIASAERLEKQLAHLSKDVEEKVKPMSPRDLARKAKEHKAMGGKS